jgi:hypothetical protein
MSKKPNQLTDQKVSTSTLLPSVFQTTPNKKMLSSTLDAMSSKGEILLFDQTFGLRTAAEPETSFFLKEADPVREESQTNTAFVVTDTAGNYTGKSSYLDISNYFNIQGLPLTNPNQLDKDLLTLDLPINNMMLTDYQQYYWLPADIPDIELTFDQVVDIDSIIGLPYATIIDKSGRTLTLADGMRLIFFEADSYSNLINSKYKSDDVNIKTFYVAGVGTAVELVDISAIDTRTPLSRITAVPWDNSTVSVPSNIKGWGGAGSNKALGDPGYQPHVDSWDTIAYTTNDPEYIVMERFSSDANPWSIINKWYHIGLIRSVARYLDIDTSTLITSANQAQRPIIQYVRDVELANWPKRPLLAEIQAYFAGYMSDLAYTNKTTLLDNNGYKLSAGDLVVFGSDNKVYRATRTNGFQPFTFTPVSTAVDSDTVMFVVQTNKIFQRLMYNASSGSWDYAQNKLTKNQAPVFEFYTVDDEKISSAAFTNDKTRGGIILDFLPSTTYDTVLERRVAVSNIDFDLVQKTNPRVVSSNQIRYRCDADIEFVLPDASTKPGPFKYKIKDTLLNLWNTRSGLDITADVQTITYNTLPDVNLTAPVWPVIESTVDIHVFPDGNEIKLYFRLNGHGYVKFSSCNSQRLSESFLPLIADRRCNIVCHDLAYPITFYSYNSTGNTISLDQLAAPYCINNGISNGIITLDLTNDFIEDATNIFNVDLTKLAWTYNNSTRSAIVRPEYKWRFLFTVYYQDKTYPIYHDYDFTVSDIINYDDTVNYKKSFNGTDSLSARANTGDKIIIESVTDNSEQLTAPSSLTKNPLNEAIGDLNYYSLYQHATDSYSGSAYIKEIIDTSDIEHEDQNEIHLKLTNGTITKHNNPLSRFAIMATNFPFDFSDILIKQGRHYDAFLTRLKSELQIVIDTNEHENFTSIELLSKALEQIYFNRADDRGFWYHSNMIGWGTALGNSVQVTVIVDSTTGLINLGSQYKLTPISHTAGQELLLHVVYNKKILQRNVDYKLISNINGYYTDIEFVDFYKSKSVYIRQWNATFNSRIPASLAKIGLAPVYQPEILPDPTNIDGLHFIHRHDGTRYCLQGSVDSDLYPLDYVEQLLWEYEKAVWSSISYDVETNDHSEYLQDKPGGFRDGLIDWNTARSVINADIVGWLSENNIYILTHDYEEQDGFTYRYAMGSGDGSSSITGSWRTIYRYFYDTDRPHTHPWEMLGYTLKPVWWDIHYSWTDANKRSLLEKNLRLGNRFEPPAVHHDAALARVVNVDDPEDFPVDSQGNLISPKDLPWLNSLLNTADEIQLVDWLPGELSPWDMAYLNTQRGLASEIKLTYLLSTTRYVANNWLPGSTVKYPDLKLNKNTQSWITNGIDHLYHRYNDTTFTAGIESLYGEFCYLNNVDFVTEVVQKFNNISAKKEFLLQGFSNKNNVRIQSTSIANQSKNLFVPEENYAVRTIKHYPHKELFYSGLRIVWDGTAWIVFGFTNEQPYFNYHVPKENSATTAITVNDVVMKEKTSYDFNKVYKLSYGTRFVNRQQLYDFIIGYGLYLKRQGFVFEEPEAGDIRNWQLSAKQYIYWSNDTLAAGNYIDLNPAADAIVLFADNYGQLENLVGNNNSPGWCVDREGKNLFSKDLLVERDSTITITAKDNNRSIYGIKLMFAMYESVVHLDGTSVFNDVYFLSNQGTTKRSFKVGGKKSYAWDGKYFVYGYMFNGDTIIPNYDSYAEQGRNLLDIESSILDPDIINASRSQFGLNRNPELRQLFLTDDTETQFKNSITFSKGTVNVFTSLEPLTHKNDNSRTVVHEEYMVRLGELGNTKNIEYYEFQLRANSVNDKDYQLIKFSGVSNNDQYVVDATDWVYTPYNKPLHFTLDIGSSSKLKISGPVMPNDTDYTVTTLKDIPYLYKEFEPLYTVKHYDETVSYKKDDQVRKDGQLYIAKDNVIAGSSVTDTDKFKAIKESYLPNIFVENYNTKNPNLGSTADSSFTPGTWQVMQTVDRNIAVVEVCTGLTDATLARITTNKDHYLSVGDYVLLVNANTANASVNGIWPVKSLEDPAAKNGTKQFYIDTRITETIKTGKMFTFKPVRFKDLNELNLATGVHADQFGYAWNPKFNPAVNQVNTSPVIVPPLTTSGFSSVHPLAIVDNNNTTAPAKGLTYDYGQYAVYSVSGQNKTPLKVESIAVGTNDIEHLVIYDHVSGKTLAKIEMFNPKHLIIPQIFLDEIDVINRVDPAKYNRTTDKFKTVYTSLAWYKEWIGRRWWDTRTIQFADYESFENDLDKYNNWGKTVNNKLPDIYEWTKSPVAPSAWNKLAKKGGDAFGTPASGEVYIDTADGKENYHWVEEQEQVNGNVYTVYYFWVKNKNVIAKESKLSRIYTCNVLSKIILNPSAVGMAWWAPIGPGSIIVKGVKPYLNNTSTVVQIKKKTQGNEKSQQWMFISDGDQVKTIPEWMHIRLRNSLSTLSVNYNTYTVTQFEQKPVAPNKPIRYNIGDVVYMLDPPNQGIRKKVYWQALKVIPGTEVAKPPGTDDNQWKQLSHIVELNDSKINAYSYHSVPDRQNLHPFNLLGNEIRPYQQSWFDDYSEARRVFIQQANLMLLNMDVINSIDGWNKNLKADLPFAESLIDMSEESGLWYRTDYSSIDYNATKKIAFTVAHQSNIFALATVPGDYIKVIDEVTGLATIYQTLSDNGYSVVYRQKGTIQFSDDLWKRSGLWDGNPWDMVQWDYDLNANMSVVVDVIRNDLFVSAYQTNYNKLMCVMFRYILNEQVNVNWLQKSSTVEPLNLISQSLDPLAELERDNITTLTAFYNNVKAYRDKLRDSDIVKSNQEPVNTEIRDSHDIAIKLYYDRHDVGSYDLPIIANTEFSKIGWDPTTFDPTSVSPDFVDSTFDSAKAEIAPVVLDETDVFTADAAVGDYIKFNNQENYSYTVYEKLDSGYKVVYISDYLNAIILRGYDTVGWDSYGWDGDQVTPESVVDPDSDAMLWDTFAWDIDQTSNDSNLQKVYTGGADPVKTVTGSTKSKYYRPLRTVNTPTGTKGEELIDLSIPDSMSMDITSLDTNNVKVRYHYYKNSVEMFIADRSLTELLHDIDKNTMRIEFSNMTPILDANLDNIQYVWVGSEKIGYTIKTDTYISGLIRSVDGTPLMDHAVTDPVYVINSTTLLVPQMPLQNLNIHGPFLNDMANVKWDEVDWQASAWDGKAIKKLVDSVNPFAQAVKNYVSS